MFKNVSRFFFVINSQQRKFRNHNNKFLNKNGITKFARKTLFKFKADISPQKTFTSLFLLYFDAFLQSLNKQNFLKTYGFCICLHQTDIAFVIMVNIYLFCAIEYIDFHQHKHNNVQTFSLIIIIIIITL